MATEAPTIEHPLDCSCSCCVQPFSYGSISKRRSTQNAQRLVPATVSLEELAFKLSLIAAISLFCFGFYSYFFSSNVDDSNVKISIYYQDLNTVEIRQYPGNEISPELISKIHHFQERPFGLPSDRFSDYCLGGVLKFTTMFAAVVLLVLITKLC